MIRHWAGERMMPCIYEICHLMMAFKISIWFEYIPSDCNKMADALSRYQFDVFWRWFNIHNLTVNPNPTRVKYIFEFEFMSWLNRDLIQKNSKHKNGKKTTSIGPKNRKK